MSTEFGEWLRRERTSRRLTYNNLQERTDIAYQNISAAERGRGRLSRDSVVRLAEGLGADVHAALLKAFFIPYDTPWYTELRSLRYTEILQKLPEEKRMLLERLAEKLAEYPSGAKLSVLLLLPDGMREVIEEIAIENQPDSGPPAAAADGDDASAYE